MQCFFRLHSCMQIPSFLHKKSGQTISKYHAPDSKRYHVYAVFILVGCVVWKVKRKTGRAYHLHTFHTYLQFLKLSIIEVHPGLSACSNKDESRREYEYGMYAFQGHPWIACLKSLNQRDKQYCIS